jgi:hypothetical protein
MPPRKFVNGMKRPEKSGRKPGTPNVVTGLVKEAIIIAAEFAGNYFANKPGTKAHPHYVHKTELAGMAAYLAQQAIEYPRSFMPLVARVLPLQINMKTEKTAKVVYRNVDEMREALRSRGFDEATIDLMMGSKRLPPGVTPKMIEAVANEENED